MFRRGRNHNNMFTFEKLTTSAVKKVNNSVYHFGIMPRSSKALACIASDVTKP